MDDKTLVEPSNDERSQWPEATEAYVRGLEEQNEALQSRIEALEAALRECSQKSDEPTTIEMIAEQALEGKSNG